MPNTLIVNARLVNEGREFDGDLRIEGESEGEPSRGVAGAAAEHPKTMIELRFWKHPAATSGPGAFRPRGRGRPQQAERSSTRCLAMRSGA